MNEPVPSAKPVIPPNQIIEYATGPILWFIALLTFATWVGVAYYIFFA